MRMLAKDWIGCSKLNTGRQRLFVGHGSSSQILAEHWPGSMFRLGFEQTTIESKTNIFRGCLPGRLTGVAVPVHAGGA
jgi:hypothetical protein